MTIFIRCAAPTILAACLLSPADALAQDVEPVDAPPEEPVPFQELLRERYGPAPEPELADPTREIAVVAAAPVALELPSSSMTNGEALILTGSLVTGVGALLGVTGSVVVGMAQTVECGHDGAGPEIVCGPNSDSYTYGAGVMLWLSATHLGTGIALIVIGAEPKRGETASTTFELTPTGARVVASF